ncbi:MAG: DUF433 domain-containing protein [Euryarchaeota archaeon]|jgi:uncharacterized protein (DUF433 family)|nr:DUF433 domain-containing protein [Euryarchaeota archaeon]
MTIVRDEDVLGGEPRVKGTRIGVRHVVAKVIDGDQTAAYVADQLDISLSEVYEALSYYYAHTDEIREIERETREAYDRFREGSLKPKEPVQ